MPNLSDEVPVQRIIKKKNKQGGHHGGAWKVAYADFVTAMMALFIVLWIMSQSQAIRQNVAQYFKNPGLLPASVGLNEKSDMGGELPTAGHSQPLQRPAPAPADVADDQRRFEETKKKIQEMIAQLPELETLKDQVVLEITDEGLRIELMEREDTRFFEVGSANVNPQAQRIFGVISKELALLPNHLTVEGHTDSRPYGRQNYSNWELSADRANAARRLMDTLGVKPGQIKEVRGYADRRLLNRQDPNDYRNRRVSIVVLPLSKDKEGPLPGNLPVVKGEAKTVAEPPKAAATPAPPLPEVPAPKPSAPAAAAKPEVAAPKPVAAPPPSIPASPALKPPPTAAPKPVAAPPPPIPAAPALKPPPPPGKAKADAARPPKDDKEKTAAAPAPPPPKESKTEKGPLEDNLDLQKQLLDLVPKINIK